MLLGSLPWLQRKKRKGNGKWKKGKGREGKGKERTKNEAAGACLWAGSGMRHPWPHQMSSKEYDTGIELTDRKIILCDENSVPI